MPITNIAIVRQGDPPPWGDIEDDDPVIHLPDETWKVSLVEAGMKSGAPSVALRLDVPLAHAADVLARVSPGDPPVAVIAETSLGSLIAILAAARGAFPEAFEGGPFALP